MLKSKLVVVLVAALGLVLTLPPGARAGDYHVYSCRTPAGMTVPTSGWKADTGGTSDVVQDSCGIGGGLIAGLKAASPHTAVTDIATWEFNAPASARIVAADLWRAGETSGGSDSSEGTAYGFWLTSGARSGEGAHIFSECLAKQPCTGLGAENDPLSAGNLVVVPSSALGGQFLSIDALCDGFFASNTCPAAPGDPNPLAAMVELFGADVLLEQAAPPTVGSVGGGLSGRGPVSGRSDISLVATDPGAGVYAVRFVLDGSILETVVPDEAGGACRELGASADGYPTFSSPTPCPTSLDADIPFDTTTIANGSHHLVVEVLDAAGNAVTALDRTLEVDNPIVGGLCVCAPPPRGPVNGSGASEQARLSARWHTGRGTRLTDVYGRGRRIEGRLVNASGAPIVGAAIEAVETPAYAGAHPHTLPVARTDRNGDWSLLLARTTPSATIAIDYRSHLGDPLPAASATLTLAVRPAIVLRIAPRTVGVGQRLAFRGEVLGGPIPHAGKQLILEARSPGTGWLEFRVIRTDAHGRFHSSYRFRYPGPVDYRFRVYSEYEGDFPFTAGASEAVGVRER